LFDARGNIIARWDAFPGRGLYPTRVWQPGEIVVDPYRIPVAPDASAPGLGRIEVGLFRRVPLETLTARDPAGQAITPTIARFKIKGESAVQLENPVEHKYGEKIALVGYSVGEQGDSLRVRLYWRALAPIEEDYTVFVHLVDASGERVAQKDDEPQQGAYPTRYWDVGETVVDEHVLPLPRDRRGDYAIQVGLYRAPDGARLPVEGGRDSFVLIALPVSR
jgi:hypothetical protein